MPGKIKVKVLAGRNLPVMDRASDTTDAFVEVKFGGITHKTDVCRKSLNPHWNSTEWYRFEVDESELQDEPLQLRLMDHDTYSANDAIGKVVISLAPLLAREANNTNGATTPGGAVMSGWIPVFDTMHGIRGELNVIVKVELFSDFNKYKTSSVGVQFFHCPMIPAGYKATAVHGFVEELVVNDDPEYQWIDKIRTPRASNEARQVAFIKLSNQVQRLVGLKAAELGANAVVGYQQDFDLEGEAGVVARAIGTAVSITPLPVSQPITTPCTLQQIKKYLDILATDEDNVGDLNQYYQTHQEELQKIVNILNPKTPSLLDDTDTIDEDEKSMESVKPSSQKSYTGGLSIYQDDYISQKSLKNLSEDQHDLNKLLNRSDSIDSTGPLRKIKQFKTNLFSKRFPKRRSSRNSDKQDDQISIQSNSSDTSRISLIDIKNEIKRMKRLKIPKLVKPENEGEEGIGMASILARYVMHAQTSLACISEAQDSENSPETIRRRTSESDPTVNVTHEDNNQSNEQEVKSVPEIRCGSLDNITSSEPIERLRKISESCPSTPMVTRSDNLLKLPGDPLYGSVSSALSAESSEIYSTSDDDDDDDDDSFEVKNNVDQPLETTSSVVQSVLSHDIDPSFVAEMEKKLTVLELASIDHALDKDLTGNNQNVLQVEKNTTEVKLTTKQDTTLPKKSPEVSTSDTKDHDASVSKKTHFNIHNIFSHKKVSKSLSAPSSPVEKKSFVYRSSKRIKRELSKISKSSMIKSLSHYSLLPKKKHAAPKPAISSLSSSSDVRSKDGSETVLGSPFLSYTDLLSLDKDGFGLNQRLHKSDELKHSNVSMYIGSEPVSRASLSGPSGSRDESHHHEQKSFKKDKPEIKPSGLIHTAMETILIDKVQSLLIPTSPDPVKTNDKKFFDDVNEELKKLDKSKLKDDNNINDTKSVSKNGRKLLRQVSVHSAGEIESNKMSKEPCPNDVNSCKLTHQPVLQHFHPIRSGAHLETIPSLSESNLDRVESLDVEGVDEPLDTNSVSVCFNSHAACGVDRNERERDKCEKEKDKDRGSPKHSRHESYGGREPVGPANVQNASVNSTSTPMGIHRRSSDSDLSITPKGSSLNASTGNTGGGAILRPSMNSNNLEMLEYPFLTMTEYPPGFIVHIGGTVCARSVKLVDGGGESAARAAWWAELRTELRAHARALRCTAVLAYCERAAVREDVCVLSASGTAAVINLDCDLSSEDSVPVSVGRAEEWEQWCSKAHVPYSAGAPPYRAELAPCGACRKARVPTVLLATCAKPNRLASYGKAVTLTAVAARARRGAGSGEPAARDLSDQLPFLEYELHKLLLAKLRMQGANALFSLSTQIAIGERCVMALAGGTAVRLAALPPPAPPRLKASENDKNAIEIQKALWETFNANKTANGYDVGVVELGTSGPLPESEAEDAPALELSADRDACLLELDEAEDVETALALSERRSSPAVLAAPLRPAPVPPHVFLQVWRARAGSACGAGGGAGGGAERMVAGALAGAAYKLRRLQPAALANTCFSLDLPEDEIQLVVSGTAIPLLEPSKVEQSNGVEKEAGAEAEDDIFALDEEHLVKPAPAAPAPPPEDKTTGPGPWRVSLSTLGAVFGARASRRVCSLRLLFVRETTAVRELGGLSGFLHTFCCEVLAIVRAYTAALGGNALTSFYITQLMLQDNAHKNQGQCLLSVGGDVVHVTY